MWSERNHWYVSNMVQSHFFFNWDHHCCFLISLFHFCLHKQYWYTLPLIGEAFLINFNFVQIFLFYSHLATTIIPYNIINSSLFTLLLLKVGSSDVYVRYFKVCLFKWVSWMPSPAHIVKLFFTVMKSAEAKHGSTSTVPGVSTSRHSWKWNPVLQICHLSLLKVINNLKITFC